MGHVHIGVGEGALKVAEVGEVLLRLSRHRCQREKDEPSRLHDFLAEQSRELQVPKSDLLSCPTLRDFFAGVPAADRATPGHLMAPE